MEINDFRIKFVAVEKGKVSYTLYSISSFDTLKQKIEKEFETNQGWVRLVRLLLLKEED